MLQAEQLGKSGQVFMLLPTAETPPALPKDLLSPPHPGSNFGLGYGYFDVRSHTPEVNWFFSKLLYAFLDSAQPALKLGLLKRQKFTPDGREQRIRDSLAALNASQPTTLTATEWKEIVEEVEDED